MLCKHAEEENDCPICENAKEAKEFIREAISRPDFNAFETLDELTTFFDGDPMDLF